MSILRRSWLVTSWLVPARPVAWVRRPHKRTTAQAAAPRGNPTRMADYMPIVMPIPMPGHGTEGQYRHSEHSSYRLWSRSMRARGRWSFRFRTDDAERTKG